MPDKKQRSRIWAYGSTTVITSLFFLGILVFGALIAERHPWRLDLTESGKYTLSEQTRNILKTVDKPIVIKAFYATAAPEQTEAKELLESYTYINKQLSYQFIDPDREPEAARQYEVRTYGTLVLEGYDKKQTIQNAEEESLTNAILKLVSKEEKKVYFLAGHGEHPSSGMNKDSYSSADSALKKENYQVADLNLLQQARVPDDAAVVLVAGPQKPLMSQEIASLRSYVEKGGKLMVLVDPYHDGGLRDFLKIYGVELHDDIIIDKLSRVFGGSYLTPVVMEYGPHKITENFNVATFFPEARSVQPMKEAPQGVQVQPLASTSPNAWAETDLEMIKQGQASFDEDKDTPGPVPLVVLATIDTLKPVGDKALESAKKDTSEETGKDQKTRKAYLVVSGNSQFADNASFGLSGNGDFFLNMVNFLAEEEQLITIESHEKGGRPILMTQNQSRLVFGTVMIFVPLLVIFSGLVVYRVRRSQR